MKLEWEPDTAAGLPPFGEVWVWRMATGGSPAASLHHILDQQEQQRAARFRFASDRDRYTQSHAALRLILSRLLGRAPATLTFLAATRGKPFLQREPGDPDLRFNLSHSGEWTLVATAVGVEVGVDMEQVRDSPHLVAMASRVLPPENVALLKGLDAADQPAQFCRYWVRHEALVKATGEGLWSGPAPDRTAWQVWELPISGDYRAAVAAAPGASTVRLWKASLQLW